MRVKVCELKNVGLKKNTLLVGVSGRVCVNNERPAASVLIILVRRVGRRCIRAAFCTWFVA